LTSLFVIKDYYASSYGDDAGREIQRQNLRTPAGIMDLYVICV